MPQRSCDIGPCPVCWPTFRVTNTPLVIIMAGTLGAPFTCAVKSVDAAVAVLEHGKLKAEVTCSQGNCSCLVIIAKPRLTGNGNVCAMDVVQGMHDICTHLQHSCQVCCAALRLTTAGCPLLSAALHNNARWWHFAGSNIKHPRTVQSQVMPACTAKRGSTACMLACSAAVR